MQNILIVDDREENLLVLETLLAQPEVNIVKALSGKDALWNLLRSEFSLVILDVQMPEMDGYETASLIRSNSKTKMIPIIFVTATYKEKKSMYKAYESGAVDYLVKPIDDEVLKSKVNIFLLLDKRTNQLNKANEALEKEIKIRKEAEEALRNSLSLVHSTINSTADGLLVIGADRKVKIYNRAFAQIWNLPENLLSTKDDNALLSHVLSQLKDPEGFIRKVNELYDKPKDESFDIIDFKDGRCIQRYSFPQVEGDNITGRVWSFHDITEHVKMQDIMKQDLVLQSSIAKVTEALLNQKCDKYYISKLVHDESLILTESEHGYASMIDDNDDNVAINLTDMMERECTIAKEQQTTKFPKGPTGYNALWGHSLNTGEGFFTSTPKGHQSYKGCTPTGHVEIKNFLSVPVKSGSKIIGQIALANSRRDYTERDLSIIERLASIYAVALERKQIEERLSESEQRFRVIFNETPVGIAITEVNTGRFVQVNKAYCSIVGYSHDEIVDYTFHALTHPDDIQQQLDGLRQLHNGDISVFNMEKRYIHKDAKVLWVSLTTVSFLQDTGKPLFYLNIVKDITHEKQLSEDLKASQIDVLEAQSKAHFGTWSYNPVTHQRQWSLEMFNIWGLDPKQGPPRSYIKHIHPADYPHFDNALREAVELGKPYTLELRIIRPDKTERVINTICEPVLDAAGKVVKLRGSIHDITERKKTEKELIRVVTLLDITGNIAKIGGWSVDVETMDLIWSKEVYNIHELDVTQPPDFETAVNFYPAEVRLSLIDKLQDCMNTGRDINIELPFITAKGNHIWVSIQSKAEREDGKIVRLIGSVQDITQRKRMEDALRVERDKLKSIMDTMEDGVYIVTKDHEIDFINRALVREFGEVNGRKCYEYFHDKNEQCAWCKNDEVFSGKSVKWEWRSSKNNRTYSLYDTPLRNVDESMYKFEIFHDITDIKTAQYLIQRELNYQKAVAEVSEALLSPDKTIHDIANIVHKQTMSLTESLYGYVSEVDSNTEELIDHAYSDMAGQQICRVDARYFRLTFPKGENGYNALWGHSLNTKQGFYTNNPLGHPSYKGVFPEGHVQLTRFLSVPAVIGDKLIGQISLANAERDYTDEDLNVITRLASIFALAVERKTMEIKLKELNTRLEAMVEEETHKRQQQEQLLIQQSKMAAMGEMLGLIGHQWRQPLNAIGMTVQDIKEAYEFGELNDEYLKDTVDATMNQVFFMSKTIDDFKNFFKTSKEKVRFDVSATVKELTAMFEQMFKKSDVDISIRTEPGTLLTTAGYPNEFKHVILNILNNAKDAITAKKETEIHGLIEINIANDEARDKIIVTVRDNGGGISTDVIEKIFEPYYTTKGEEGTGIGLYMCKTIIEANMGGSLTVRNIDGGAEFIIELTVSKLKNV
ncbi:MAG: PAS domain S-box protein [Nitrospirota bacterium]